MYILIFCINILHMHSYPPATLQDVDIPQMFRMTSILKPDTLLNWESCPSLIITIEVHETEEDTSYVGLMAHFTVQVFTHCLSSKEVSPDWIPVVLYKVDFPQSFAPNAILEAIYFQTSRHQLRI